MNIVLITAPTPIIKTNKNELCFKEMDFVSHICFFFIIIKDKRFFFLKQPWNFMGNQWTKSLDIYVQIWYNPKSSNSRNKSS
jgi:hypothetical protein